MKKTSFAAALCLAAGLTALSGARAEERSWAWSPLGVGIAAPVQLPFMSSDVYGIRFGGFFGCNRDVYGLDAGVANVTAGDFGGLQAGAFNWAGGSVWGIQAGAVANVVRGHATALQVGAVNAVFTEETLGMQVGLVNWNVAWAGLQFGALNWNNVTACGWQVALVNADQDDFAGFAAGAVNYASRATGLQLGIINLAEEAAGLQLGVINAANRMKGLQIGALNLICEDSVLRVPVMPVANASF